MGLCVLRRAQRKSFFQFVEWVSMWFNKHSTFLPEDESTNMALKPQHDDSFYFQSDEVLFYTSVTVMSWTTVLSIPLPAWKASRWEYFREHTRRHQQVCFRSDVSTFIPGSSSKNLRSDLSCQTASDIASWSSFEEDLGIKVEMSKTNLLVLRVCSLDLSLLLWLS